ncbi:dual specificity protein phosphatase 13A-like isoform X2 [Rhinoderma darwinii]|uniref:dual specificity protein phosphatase 13A-like isoform X2 n=1 Tax=Rhinoderma darwinii TaxID=43563 RepID=UPI003F67B5A1
MALLRCRLYFREKHTCHLSHVITVHLSQFLLSRAISFPACDVMAENTEKCSTISRAGESQADVNPTVAQLQSLLDSRRTSFTHRVDEVWPNLFLGDLNTANNRYELWKLGITHVLNVAHGRRYTEGNPDFYGASITYHGVPANDVPDFDMSKYFYSASEFIHTALTTPGARILVHCVVGISRSATLILAYLMIHHQLSLVQAIHTVQKNRWISPNAGFLRQLLHLDEELCQTRQSQTETNQHGEKG